MNQEFADAAGTAGSTFDVYVREENGNRVGTAIKRGFCWPALFFSWAWAFAHRLWPLGIVLLTVTTIINTLWVYFSEDKPVVGWAFTLINGAFVIFMAFKANEFQRARREAEGFHQETTVNGRTPAEVLATLQIQTAGSLTYSLGGVIAAGIFSAIAVFSIMVGMVGTAFGDRSYEPLSLLVSTAAPALFLWYRSLRPPLNFLRGFAWGAGGWLLTVPVVTVLTLSGVGERRPEQNVHPTGPRITSIAVLPLMNTSGDPQQDTFAVALTNSLFFKLSASRSVKHVLQVESLAPDKGSPRAATLQELIANTHFGPDLGVDALLFGSTKHTDARILLTLELIYVPSHTTLWSNAYDYDLTLRNLLIEVASKEISARVRS